MSRTPLFPDPINDTGQKSAPFGKGVTLTRSHGFAGQGGAILSIGLLIIVTCLTPAPALGQSSPNENTTTGWGALPHRPRIQDGALTPQIDAPRPLNDKQRAILKANFEKTKKDAAEMASLAKELREGLNKPNADAPALEVVNLADKIEKLARKIREETKGF
jgi:hypothetical protein